MLKKIIYFMLLIPLLYGQEKIPDMSLKLLNGKSTNLYQLLGDGPVIIDFLGDLVFSLQKINETLR